MKESAQKSGPFPGGIFKSRPLVLEKRNIILNCPSVTPEEAIRTCGRLMLESGYIEEGYVQAMLERNRSDSVAIGSQTAIPHSGSRQFVRKTGVAVMTCPDGIDWNGEKVRLVIGIASKGEDHLEILRRVAAMTADGDDAGRLVDGADLNVLYAGLNGLDMAQIERPLLEKRNIVLNCKSVTPEEAIRACGRLLVESGYASEGYIQNMLERNARLPVSVGNYVAIPHGTGAAQKFIRRTGIAVMTYPDGIQWGDKIVRLVIGIAPRGEEHLEILDRIVEAAGTENGVMELVNHASVDGLYRKLNGLT